MWKKIILSIIIILILTFGIKIFYKTRNNSTPKENVNVTENITEISSKYVTDDCIDEWEDYANSVQAEIEETAQRMGDENKHYIVNAENDYINVYYINEKNEKILYKKTEISTEYLSTEDVEKLEEGIDIYGIEELNKLLEDFE